MNRRSFISALFALPFARFLKSATSERDGCNIHVNALDKEGIKRVLNGNLGAIAKAIRDAQKAGHLNAQSSDPFGPLEPLLPLETEAQKLLRWQPFYECGVIPDKFMMDKPGLRVWNIPRSEKPVWQWKYLWHEET